MRQLRFAVPFVLIGCTAAQEPAPTVANDPVARSILEAADEAAVPRELMMAIAIEEGGIKLAALRHVQADDHVPVAGALELRHGRLNTLALGAQLMGTTEDTLRADTDLATRAGARVLAQLGTQYGAKPGDLASWRRALEVLSGMDDTHARDYASRVFAILRTGGEFAARGSETVRVAPHLELAVTETLATARIGPPPVDGFPGAIWFQTSCTDKCTPGRPLGNNSVDKIVIHDTEGGWDGSVATLQFDPGKSVHYIIDADGSRLGQFRGEGDTTYHGGNFFYNETSIGIEHVGVAADPAGYSSALYAKSIELVQDIRTRWSVPLDRTHIIGHYQIPDGSVISESSGPCDDTLDACENSARFGGASNHRDPGYNWQWCQYMEKLGGSCTCNDAWENFNCTTDKTEAVRCRDGVVEIQNCTGGCEVMPIGTEDVCHIDGGPGPDAGVPGGGDGSGSGSNPDDPTGDQSGGCSIGSGSGSGSASGAACLLAALAVFARRRRR
jgi:N-acetyl-anhydromuramyl-L-alanine amidase AmpD